MKKRNIPFLSREETMSAKQWEESEKRKEREEKLCRSHIESNLLLKHMLPWHDHLNETKPQVPRMVVFRARRKLNVPPQHDNSFYIMVRVLHISACFFLFIQFSPLFYIIAFQLSPTSHPTRAQVFFFHFSPKLKKKSSI